ncbi:MAG: hypothetical protein N2111_13665 [Candidatus Sumerlaeaceae bacterium]|nr:hypothetical protein [Candidatus Sumerlaeaceae bacterium]
MDKETGGVQDHFVYFGSSIPVHLNDKVIYAGEPFVVTGLFYARTQEADDWSCFETGGVQITSQLRPGLVIVLDDPYDAEDLEFVERGTTGAL